MLSEDVEERLRLLASVACILGIDDVCFLSYSAAITRLSARTLSAKRSLNRLDYVENCLRGHLASARREERLIRKWRDTLGSELQTDENAASLERRTEALLESAEEYRKELDTLVEEMPEGPSVTVTELVAQKDRIRQKEQDLKEKRTKIKAFQGLPPNLDLARHELRNARDELMKLVRLRERLLGRMAEGVA